MLLFELPSTTEELENLLREKDTASSTSPRSRSPTSIHSYDSASLLYGIGDIGMSDGSLIVRPLDMATQFSSGSTSDDLAGIATLVGNPLGYTSSNTSHSGFNGTEVSNLSWPRHLPYLSLLRHL